ncbi:glycoside hydrolase family 19 protein [uncultured Bacteroides sp.]|uniref:glycoside hydrolase family 19 protein n=1 Tax=uncultured Bacteroides sp. TaxID=162156 RepID=UPI002AA8A6E2|nr:glycoside hydrolase family 19 protein [uncultured Bacteroides sp.]
MQQFCINTTLRAAHFIAQIAHETGSFVYVKEIASGAAYDTGRLAAKLGNTPAADGDGQKYKGRGYIQLTGKSNYEMFDKFTGGKYDLLNHPERVEEPALAMLVAGWYWNKKSLNTLADKDDIDGITHTINGGVNGLNERKAFLLRAKKVLL